MNSQNKNLNFFSKQLQALIMADSHDSFKARAYLCPANRLTIGYGHVLLPTDAPLFNLEPPQLARMIKECMKSRRLTPDASRILRINLGVGMQLLQKDVRIAAEFLLSATTVPLNQNQFDALIDFIFNVGQANYATSTLKRKLNAGQYQAAAREFDRWVFAKVNGNPSKLPGLVKRRAAERKLFETPV